MKSVRNITMVGDCPAMFRLYQWNVMELKAATLFTCPCMCTCGVGPVFTDLVIQECSGQVEEKL